MWCVAMVITLYCSPILNGQSITSDDLRWSVTEVLDVQTGETLISNESVVTYGTNAIEWLGPDEEVKMSFEIDEIQGSWIMLSQDGSLLMKDTTKEAEILFERKGGLVGIRILVIENNGPVIHELSISSIDVN